MTTRLLMLILLSVTGVESTWAGDMTAVAIDELMRHVWRANKLEPSPLCSDGQFLRRLSLEGESRVADDAVDLGASLAGVGEE